MTVKWYRFVTYGLWLVFAGSMVQDFVHSPTRFRETCSFVNRLVLQMCHGHLNGEFHGVPSHLDERDLEPGDIILCHNTHGGYGYYTHAVLYTGHGLAVDSDDFVHGTHLSIIDKFKFYDSTIVLRPEVSLAKKQAIVRAAMAQVGKPYDLFQSVTNSNSEYCSKLIWETYKQNGILLCPPASWITPDDLSHSPLFVKTVGLGGARIDVLQNQT